MNSSSRKMQFVQGKKFAGNELPQFTWNADLIEFDGPFVSLFKSDRDDDALFVWLDCDKYKNRWCIAQLARGTLREYLNATIALRDVIDRAGELYLYDVGSSGRRSNFVAVSSELLPSNYLPAPDSYLDLSFATEAAIKLASEATELYEFKLDGDLYLEDVSAISKLITQLYSFHYGLNYSYRPAVREKLLEIMSKWHGGINAVNIFSGLKSVIPSIHRPKINRLLYASPGYIELDALPELTGHIEDSLRQVLPASAFEKTEALYSAAYVYFRKEKLSGFDDHSSVRSSSLTTAQAAQLESFIQSFFDALNWQPLSAGFKSLDNSPLSRLRVVLAYYRRLRNLRDLMQRGKVKV